MENRSTTFPASPAAGSRGRTFSWVTDLAGAALLAGLFYALWMGHHPLFTPDEGRYPEVAREMVATGDYITPRLNGVAFLDKPILYYWLQAFAIRLFGLNEWAIRFWPVLFGVTGILATLTTGRLLFNRRTGWLAALLLATCPLWYGAAHYANLDLEVAVLVSLSLFTLLAAENLPIKSPRIRSLLHLSAWSWAALAFLTKGMIGLAFPLLIFGLWLLFAKDKRSLLAGHPWRSALLLFALIVLPWYCLVQQANPGFWHFFFVTQQVSRFLSHDSFNNVSPVWFYVPVLLAGFFPWTIFAIQGLVSACRTAGLRGTRGFLLLWFLVILIFFSLPKSKTIGYILPALPPLALLTACHLDAAWEKRPVGISIRTGLRLFQLIAFIFLPAVCVIAWWQKFFLWPWLTASTAVFFVTAIWLVCLPADAPFARAWRSLLLSAVGFLLIFLCSASTLNQNSLKPLALSLRPLLTPADEVVTWYNYWHDVPLYLERRITAVTDWQAADIPLRDNWVRELWYGMPFQDTSHWLINEKTFWQRWNSDQRLFVLLDKKRYPLFLAHAHGARPVRRNEYNDVLLMSNK